MRAEEGANAVEFALVLPILIVLVFGIISGGMLYNQQLNITQAAREGARFGATLPQDVDDPPWEERVVQRTVGASGGMIGENNVVRADIDDDRVVVRVEAEGSLDLALYEFSPLTLSAETFARYELGD